jgi:GDPmannose 4,6-dehydratase
MWLMLGQKEPLDFVVATGVDHSVRDFAAGAFDHVGLNWRKYVKVDKEYYRPAEVHHLLGDSTRARVELGWKPRVDFNGLVQMMVDADIARLKRTGKKR